MSASAHPQPMPAFDFTAPPARVRGPVAVRFLLLALVLHAAMLLLPVSRDTRMAPQPAVELTLVTPPAPIPPERLVLPEPAEPLVPPAPPQAQEEPQPAPAPSAQQEPRPAPTREPIPEEALPPLDMDELLQAIAEFEREDAVPEARVLGRDTSSPLYERLSRPLLSGNANVLDGTVAPSEVEIVDRWMAPGGVHNVVIRSPDGKTYCGRQEAVDDLRPWLQMPMMFRSCAGGGKRSGTPGWRNN